MLEVVTAATNIKLTTAAAVEDDVGITLDADWVSAVIDECSQLIASHLNRVLAQEVFRETLRHTVGEDCIVLSRYPVVSISSIVDNGTTLTTDDYEVDKTIGVIWRLSGDSVINWPKGKVVINFTSGYVLPGETGRNLPFDIERACKELVKARLYAKGRDPALKSLVLPNVEETEYWINKGSLPPEIAGMVDPYRAIKIKGA